MALSQSTTQKSPGAFVDSVFNAPVIVKMSNSETDYRGHLIGLDGFLNVVLAPNSVEYDREGKCVGSYSHEVFLRGNNVLYVGLQE